MAFGGGACHGTYPYTPSLSPADCCSHRAGCWRTDLQLMVDTCTISQRIVTRRCVVVMANL